MIKKSLFILAFGFLVLSFLSSNVKSQSLLRKGRIPKDLMITLERTMCFGKCPVYKLSIDNEGKVVFEGLHFTETTGRAEKTITQNQLRKIIVEFEKAKFFGLRNSYRDKKDGCARFVTDHPSEIISIQSNGKTKKISHYFGCQAGKPTKTLEELGNKIDELAGTNFWIGNQKSAEELKEILQ